MLSKLYSDNQATSGIDIEEGVVRDMSGEVLDNLSTKQWGIKLATDVALTVLRVDQIIMSKPSGGPNPNKRPQQEED